MARKLFYRVVEVKLFKQGSSYAWEAYLLIQGQGKPIRGTLSSPEQLLPSMEAAIAVAYKQVTGSLLPRPNGQLPLLDTA